MLISKQISHKEEVLELSELKLKIRGALIEELALIIQSDIPIMFELIEKTEIPEYMESYKDEPRVSLFLDNISDLDLMKMVEIFKELTPLFKDVDREEVNLAIIDIKSILKVTVIENIGTFISLSDILVDIFLSEEDILKFR